jgi:hypothetical protein
MYLLQLSGHLAEAEEPESRRDEMVKEDAVNRGLAAVEAEQGCAMAAEVPCAGYPVVAQDQVPVPTDEADASATRRDFGAQVGSACNL